MRFFQETELKGTLVTLVPIRAAHAGELIAAATDGELWKLWFTGVPNTDTIDRYIAKAIGDYELDTGLAFVIRDHQSGRIIGSTRYTNASPKDRRVEIGYTWYAKSFQRTGVNTECKMLLLTHAFETLHCIAVEFRTHWMNHASRRAIERLGAKQDGVLRNHLIMPDGTYRDTVVYSIIESEWNTCRTHLKYNMSIPTGKP